MYWIQHSHILVGKLLEQGILSTREEGYIEAARAIGCKSFRIMVCHIFPNLIGSLLVYTTLQLGRKRYCNCSRAEFPRVGRSAASSRMGVDSLSGERSDWVGLVGFNLSRICCPLGRSLF